MQAKKPEESRISMSYMMLPQDTNQYGRIHGGVILKYIDTTAGVVSSRHSRKNTVTVCLDRTDFLLPIFVGELVTFKANVNMVGKTSMEVGVRVEAENLTTGEVRHTNSAYLTMVALDENGKPTSVPPLLLENETDKRREREAQTRRKQRNKLRMEEQNSEKN